MGLLHYSLKDMLLIAAHNAAGCAQSITAATWGYSFKGRAAHCHTQCCLLRLINHCRYMVLQLETTCCSLPRTMLLTALDQSLPIHWVTA